MVTGNIGKVGSGVNPLRGQNNVQGACDMGSLPDVYTGYQKVAVEEIRLKFEQAWGMKLPDEPGLVMSEMIPAAHAGTITAMYIMGENPVLSEPDATHVIHSLQKLDFLVVQDIFLTETAQLADVVLPGVSFAEKDGTFTNTERRVQMVHKAIEPLGDAKPDWQIIEEIAKAVSHRLGLDESQFEFAAPFAVMEEIARVTPSYGGISHERLDQVGGLQWPCPNAEHPGTPILHVGKFSRGLGRFTPLKFIPPAEMPDEDYPLVLTTGRKLYHYHTGSMTRRVRGLQAVAPEERVEVHPVDAEALEICNGDLVKVSSRRGEVTARAEVTDRVPIGVIFMTFHYAESAANLLTNTALDPVSKMPEVKVCAVRVERAVDMPASVEAGAGLAKA
jgi:formate dehydrogenase major subunit/formate dehydrogenase alpha subunit